MFIRKLRSFFKKMISKIRTLYNYLILLFLEENITIGKNVVFGKNINIKTSDGGSISINDNVCIENNCHIYAQNGKIIIGKNSFIGFGSQLVAKESISIGKDCLISAYSIIRDANHGIQKNKLINTQQFTIKKIIIEDDVWIGSHSVITSGTTIYKGVVVGANAVVTKDVNLYSVVGGVPAKFIKMRVD